MSNWPTALQLALGGAPQPIDVVLVRTSDAGSVADSVQVAGSQGVKVSCSEGGAATSSCSLAFPPYSGAGEQIRTTARVRVSLVANSTTEPPRIELRSETTAPQLQTVSITPLPSASNASGTYSGELWLDLPGVPRAIQVEVTATLTSLDNMLIHDSSYLVSANGNLPLSRGKSVAIPWVQPIQFGIVPSSGSAPMQAQLGPVTLAGNALDGQFQLKQQMSPASQTWRFHLERGADPIRPCGKNSDCATGGYCDTVVALCATGPAPQTAVDFRHGPLGLYNDVAVQGIGGVFQNLTIAEVRDENSRPTMHPGSWMLAAGKINAPRDLGIESLDVKPVGPASTPIPDGWKLDSRRTALANGCTPAPRLQASEKLTAESLKKAFATRRLQPPVTGTACSDTTDAAFTQSMRTFMLPCLAGPRDDAAFWSSEGWESMSDCRAQYIMRNSPLMVIVLLAYLGQTEPAGWKEQSGLALMSGAQDFVKTQCVETDLSALSPQGQESHIYLCPTAHRNPLSGASMIMSGRHCTDKAQFVTWPGTPWSFNPSGMPGTVVRCKATMAADAPYLPARDAALVSLREVGSPKSSEIAPACERELAFDSYSPSLASNIGELGSTQKKCIDVPRLFSDLALLGDWQEHSNEDGKRLLGQLTDVLGFTAASAVLSGKLNPIGDDSETTIQSGAERESRRLTSVMTQLEAYWLVFADPSVSGKLYCTGACPDILRYMNAHSVDWAPRSDGTVDPARMATPLPVGIYENLSSFAALVERSAKLQSEASYANCTPAGQPPAFTNAIRLMVQLDQLADAMGHASDAIPPSVAALPAVKNFLETRYNELSHINESRAVWKPAFARSQAVFRRALGDAARAVAVLTRCGNPLGLDENDLPLYFAGPASSSDRFFASSDFLSQLAVTQQARAKASLEEARSAWRDQTNVKVQEKLQDDERDRRLEALRIQAGTTFASLCGLSDQAADVYQKAVQGTVNPETCHIRDAPECKNVMPLPQTCFRGLLGEAAANIMAARSDVTVAEDTRDAAQGQYDQQTNYCIDLEASQDAQLRKRREHKAQIDRLSATKATLDIVALGLDSATTCSAHAAASFGAVCGPAIASAVVKGISVGVQADIEGEERAHQIALAEFAKNDALLACHNEAEMRFLQIPASESQIVRRGIDVGIQLQRFLDLQASFRSTLETTRAAVELESGRTVPSLARNFWYSERLQTYEYDLDRAKKLTFLALRAVEYETQVTLPFRTDIVSAHHAETLKRVLDRLDEVRLTRTVNGQRPDHNVKVMSLRDEILKLRWDPNTGKEIPLDAANAKLRELVTAPEAAFFSSTGAYLGQALRFALPRDVLPEALCAQRIWSVQASLQGNLSLVAPDVRLLKRNVFGSDWCIPSMHPADSEQVGRVRANDSLFGSARGEPTFASAAFTAKVNATRGDLQSDAGAQLASEELAGRGIYGEYVFLLPKQLLASPDFDIQGLEDILVRFDFVRVSQGI